MVISAMRAKNTKSEGRARPDEASLAAVRQFQSETDAIREAPEPLGARLAIWVLAGLVASCVLVTFFVRIDRVVTSGGGKIVSTLPVDVFQALDASIIKSIDVKEGDEVMAGQVLATLDQTFAAADVDQLKAQIASLDAQIARAEAEIKEQPFALPAFGDGVRGHYALLQKALFDQRAAAFAAQAASFSAKIEQTEATIVKLKNDVGRYGEREKISRNIEEMRSRLLERQAGSLLNLLNSQDQRLELLRTLESDANALVESRHLLASLRADREAFRQQWFASVSQELVTARSARDAALAQLSKAAKHQDLVRLVAPEKAIVLTMAKLSVGSVLSAGDKLMTLMPLRSPLEAEVEIASRDVGFVRPGDKARLKIDAFNYFEHGMAEGKVRWISEGAFTLDDNGKPVDAYYKARIGIDAIRFVDVPLNFRLIPGMTLTADINVGTRSVLRYLLGGALHGVGEAMREP